MQITRTTYLEKLIRRKNNGLIKIVTGIRRSGKSYLLNTLFYNHLLETGVAQDHIIRFAFDSADDLEHIGENLLELQKEKRKVNPEKFMAFIKSRISSEGTYYLLLDEVQLLDCFESVLNGYLRRENLDVYVTGSNSKFLSSDIITEFRGRGDEIRVHPLSFSEYVSAHGGSKEEAWDDFVNYGSLPYTLYLQDDEDKAGYLKNLFSQVYLTDIVDRHKVRNAEELDEILDILSSAVGSLTNPLKLSNTFKSVKGKTISDHTIKKYIDYFEDAFILNKAKRYDIKGKKHINSLVKYYFEDAGLRNARLNFRQTEESHLMENIIYNELLIRGFSVDVGVVEVFGKSAEQKTTKSKLEVDFIASKGSRKYYIQSALSIASEEKSAQEMRPFRNIGDSFRKIIVVRDNIKLRRTDDGIEIVGVMNFLLDESILG